jgi:hypothetical protein
MAAGTASPPSRSRCSTSLSAWPGCWRTPAEGISAGQLLAYEAVFGGMGLASVYWVLEVYRQSVRVHDAGFEVRRLLLGRVSVTWGEIVAVRYSALLKVLKVHRKRGRCCWLSTGLDGLGTFRAYLARYASGVVDPAACGAMPRAVAPGEWIPQRPEVFTLSPGTAWKRKP